MATGHDGSLLEDSDFCGDPLFELQALMADMNLKDKQDAREARNFEEAAAEQALQRSLEAMKDQADQQMWSGIFGGLGQVAGGMASGLGGGGEGGGLITNAKVADSIRLGGGLVQGTTTLLGANAQGNVTRAQAAEEAARADKEAAERRIGDAQAAASDAQDAMRTTIGRLEEILANEEKAKQAAIRA